MGKLGDRLPTFRGHKEPSTERHSCSPEGDQARPLSEMLQRRARRVSESLLENERLTADLDDSAAQVLLDWGLTLGSRIVTSTADIEDDEQAEEAMYPRLRATRRLMRSVNQWVGSGQNRDQEGSSKALQRIIEQAQLIYGHGFRPPSKERRRLFLQVQSELLDDPPRLIANLRQLFVGEDDA